MDALHSLAGRLAQLTPDPQARMNYDLFAGGLFWSDERPTFDPITDGDEIGKWRVLLNYRSSLTLGEPRVKFRELWEQAQALCPQWPGFAPERRDPSLLHMQRRHRVARGSGTSPNTIGEVVKAHKQMQVQMRALKKGGLMGRLAAGAFDRQKQKQLKDLKKRGTDLTGWFTPPGGA
jgi:hypothetical protein